MLTGARERSFGPEAFRADAVVRHRAGPDPATLQEAVMADAYPTPTVVYGLWSTRDRVIRYIGQTTSGLPEARLAAHRHAAKRGARSPVARWIAAEIADGHAVEMRLLCRHGAAATSEREYIALYRAMGAPLLNVRSGSSLDFEMGERLVSAETRRKMSNASRGRRHTEATKIKLMRAAYEIEMAVARTADYHVTSFLTGPLA